MCALAAPVRMWEALGIRLLAGWLIWIDFMSVVQAASPSVLCAGGKLIRGDGRCHHRHAKVVYVALTGLGSEAWPRQPLSSLPQALSRPVTKLALIATDRALRLALRKGAR